MREREKGADVVRQANRKGGVAQAQKVLENERQLHSPPKKKKKKKETPNKKIQKSNKNLVAPYFSQTASK
jgi:hypothetical protein